MEEMIINNEIIDTKEEVNYEKALIVEAVKKVKDPFKMLTIEDAMKDLNISYAKAHAIFREKNFPAIEIGKQKRVAILAYMIWKMRNIESVVK